MAKAVGLLPEAAITRAWGWLARRQRPRAAVQLLQHLYVHLTGCDLSEAAAPLGAYPDLESLFVRALRPGARPIDPAADAWVSPVDGTIGASGELSADTLLQVKGSAYSAGELLGDDALAAPFAGGSYVTLYLSPRDYHRIHTPAACQIAAGNLIPGRLLPVYPAALEATSRLLCRNERVVLFLDTDAGRIALVAVGATLVGRIRLDFDPQVATNRRGGKRRSLSYSPPHTLAKGAQLGAFELGSTVVLLAPAGALTFAPCGADQLWGAKVKVGQPIGRMPARQASGPRPDSP